MKLFLVLIWGVICLSLVSAAVFSNLPTAVNVKPGDVIKQGASTFTVESTSAQGGVILKVNGVTLLLNAGQKIKYGTFEISSKLNQGGGVDVTFNSITVTAPSAQVAGQGQISSNAVLEINPEAVALFNKNTNDAFKDFNFKTKTKGNTYIVSAWKKVKTTASSKDGIESYTFLRGAVMYIDKTTGVAAAYYSTN